MRELVKHVVLSGNTFEPVRFDVLASKYLVKNFSSGDIYVSFSENATDSDSIKITKDSYEVCIINESNHSLLEAHNMSKVIYIKGSGEVEVQVLCWM